MQRTTLKVLTLGAFALGFSQSSFATESQCPFSGPEALAWAKSTKNILISPEDADEAEKVVSFRGDMACLGDEALEKVCAFPNLEALYIYNDQCDSKQKLVGDNFHLLGRLKKLDFIDFDYNQIKVENLLKLNELPLLKNLKLLGNGLGRQDLRALSKLKVSSLVVGDNNWSEADPEALRFFIENSDAKILNFGGVSGIDLSADQAVFEAALGEVRRIKPLKEIGFSVPLSGRALQSVFQFPGLEKLVAGGYYDGEQDFDLSVPSSLTMMFGAVQGRRVLTQLGQGELRLTNLEVDASKEGILSVAHTLKLPRLTFAPGSLELEIFQSFLPLAQVQKIAFPPFFHFKIGEDYIELDSLEGLEILAPLCGKDRCFVLDILGYLVSFEERLEQRREWARDEQR